MFPPGCFVVVVVWGGVCIFLVAWLLPCWGELFVVEREISG